MGSRILVVDDEPDLRFLLRRCFERAGYDVSDAGDGGAALRAVWNSRPDLVVTDLMMPGMSGLVLIGRLRADPATAGIPILVVSSNWEMATDVDAALDKPFDRAELLAVAEGLIRDGRDGR